MLGGPYSIDSSRPYDGTQPAVQRSPSRQQ
eukprot:COSAG01_NODE_18876_length_1047_cov_1.573840_3_plen_29_part_01